MLKFLQKYPKCIWKRISPLIFKIFTILQHKKFIHFLICYNTWIDDISLNIPLWHMSEKGTYKIAPFHMFICTMALPHFQCVWTNQLSKNIAMVYHHMWNWNAFRDITFERPILCIIINDIQFTRIIHCEWCVCFALNTLSDHFIIFENKIVYDHQKK